MNARHIDMLLEELRDFQSHTKSEFADIKKEIKKLEVSLDKLKKVAKDDQTQSFSFENYKSLSLALNSTLEASTHIRFMNFTSRLFNLNVLNKYEEFYFVLVYLGKVVVIRDHDLTIRLQQILVSLISPLIMSILKSEYVQLALIIMMKLRQINDNTVVVSLNYAIESEIIRVITDQALKYDKTTVQDNYVSLYKDFYGMISKQHVHWINPDIQATPEIGIECISLMLSLGEKIFKENLELENHIQNQLLDALIDLCDDEKLSDIVYTKVIKIQAKIMCMVRSKYNLLNKFDFGREKGQQKRRLGYLESYAMILQRYDTFQSYFMFSTKATEGGLSSFLKSICEIAKISYGESVVYVSKRKQQKNYLTIFNDFNSPDQTTQDVLLTVTDILRFILTHLSELWNQISTQNDQQELFRQKFEKISKDLYNAFKMTIAATQTFPLDMNSSILPLMAVALHLSVTVEKQKIIDLFFKLICQSISNSTNFDSKVIFTTQIVFCFFDSHPEWLSDAVWEQLVAYFNHQIFLKTGESQQMISQIQNNGEKSDQHSQISIRQINPDEKFTLSKPIIISLEDLNSKKKIFIERILSFFKISSEKIQPKQLKQLIAALERSTYDSLESIKTSTTIQENNQFKIWSLEMLVEAVTSNVHRIEPIWKSISAIIITMCTSQDHQFRVYSTRFLAPILTTIAEHYSIASQNNHQNNDPSITNTQNEESMVQKLEDVQAEVFSLWETLSNSEFTDVKTVISHEIERFTTEYSPTLIRSQRLILIRILILYSDIPNSNRIIENFMSLINIISSLEHSLSSIEEVELIMKALQSYINISGDESIIYHSCEQFLLLMRALKGIHGSLQGEAELDEINNNCKDILYCLVQIAGHNNEEIRDQAVNCLRESIVADSTYLPFNFWTNTIFKEILFKLSSETISKLYEIIQDPKIPLELTIEWKETSTSVIETIGQIVKVFVETVVVNNQSGASNSQSSNKEEGNSSEEDANAHLRSSQTLLELAPRSAESFGQKAIDIARKMKQFDAISSERKTLTFKNRISSAQSFDATMLEKQNEDDNEEEENKQNQDPNQVDQVNKSNGGQGNNTPNHNSLKIPIPEIVSLNQTTNDIQGENSQSELAQQQLQGLSSASKRLSIPLRKLKPSRSLQVLDSADKEEPMKEKYSHLMTQSEVSTPASRQKRNTIKCLFSNRNLNLDEVEEVIDLAESLDPQTVSSSKIELPPNVNKDEVNQEGVYQSNHAQMKERASERKKSQRFNSDNLKVIPAITINALQLKEQDSPIKDPNPVSLIKKKSKEEELNSDDEISCLELFLIILGDFASFRIHEIVILCCQQLRTFVVEYTKYVPSLQPEIITIIDRFDDFFSQIPVDLAEIKVLFEKGMIEGILLLEEILKFERLPRKQQHEQLEATSMALMYKIMIFPNLVEQTFSNVIARIPFPEEAIFDLLHKIVQKFKTKRTVHKSIFICFLKEFFEEDMCDPYFDRMMKRILLVIGALVAIEEKLNKKYIYDLFVHISKLILLKFSSDYHHFWNTILSNSEKPLWYEATDLFVLLAHQLIKNNLQVSEIVNISLSFFKQETKEQDKIIFKSDEDMMLFLDHDKNLLLFILKHFALGECVLKVEDVLEIGVLIHDFSQRRSNLQIEKIHLLEKFQAQSFSQFCLEALFQISNYIEGSTELRRQHSQIFLPFFLSRAQVIFDKFISTIELQASKQSQLKEVQTRQFLHFLQNLSNLTIPENTFHNFKSNTIYSSLPYKIKRSENSLLNNSKGHLCYLMPQLLECVMCHQPEVRSQVKSIITQYHRIVGVQETP